MVMCWPGLANKIKLNSLPVPKKHCFLSLSSTLNSAYNEKKYAEILLCYSWLFVKGDIFIGKRGIFGAEVFLHYRRFFVESDFVICGVVCISFSHFLFSSSQILGPFTLKPETKLTGWGLNAEDVRYQPSPSLRTK